MESRTTTAVVEFQKPFRLSSRTAPLPAGRYRVDTEEEMLEGLSFPAWRRTSMTIMHHGLTPQAPDGGPVDHAHGTRDRARYRWRDIVVIGTGDTSSPRWDGHRLLFELSMRDGITVRCAISRLALLGISGGGPFKTADLLARFALARLRIEAAAYAKLLQRSTPPLGILHIWEDDVLDPFPGTSPRAMEACTRRR